MVSLSPARDSMVGWILKKWATAKINTVESSILSFFLKYFWKLRWGMENDNTLFNKRYHLLFDLGHQSSFVLRCTLFDAFVEFNSIHHLFDRQTAKSYFEQVVSGDVIAVWWWSVFAAVCAAACWVNFKYCTATYQSFASTLASDDAPCWRKEKTRSCLVAGTVWVL